MLASLDLPTSGKDERMKMDIPLRMNASELCMYYFCLCPVYSNLVTAA